MVRLSERCGTQAWRRALGRFALFGGLLALAGCEPAGDKSAPPAPPPAAGAIDEATDSLALTVVEETPAVLVLDLTYTRREGQAGPRTMELFVDYDAERLAFAGSSALAALQAAGKELVVQDRAGALRLIAFATTNVARLDSGPLARLRFTRKGSGPATLGLRAEPPVFAPAEANEGLRLQAPLTFGGR